MEPIAQAPRARWVGWVLALLLVGGLCLRLQLVASWHAPAGDGIQYYELSQELRAHGRFALGHPPAPLSYARLPGYPLFLAYVAVRKAPVSLDRHLRAATVANVLLDLGTALLVFLILRRFGAGPALAGVALLLACPIMIRLSCYGLTESLATFLGTLELYLALHAMRGRLFVYAALCGAVAGLAELVRVDAILVAPAVAMALAWADAPRRRRLQALGLWAAAAALLFAPWPIRNLVQFGAPHPGGSSFRRLDGTPLPMEILAWERTWASSAPGESYIDLPFVFNRSLDVRRPGIVLPAMYDSPAERQQVVAMFERYNRERFSPEVIRELANLAAARLHRHPLRTLVLLPLERIGHLWSPEPEYELPLRSSLVGPLLRQFLHRGDELLLALALLGAFGMGVPNFRMGRENPSLMDGRRLAWLCGVCILSRTLLFSFAIPNATNERYATEAYPMVVMLAAYALAVVLPTWFARLRDQWPRQWRTRPTSV